MSWLGFNYSHHNLRGRLLSALGGKCAACGFSNPACLDIDHVLGNGAAERAMAGNSYRMMKLIAARVAAGSPDYQLLCKNCNWEKRIHGREWGGTPPNPVGRLGDRPIIDIGRESLKQKLSDAQVLEILSEPRTRGYNKRLAERYGVSRSLISQICTGQHRNPAERGPSTLAGQAPPPW